MKNFLWCLVFQNMIVICCIPWSMADLFSWPCVHLCVKKLLAGWSTCVRLCVILTFGLGYTSCGAVKFTQLTETAVFFVLLTMHLSINLVNDKFSKWPTWCTVPLFYNTFITVPYLFRAMSCSSSGGQIVLRVIQHLVRPLTESDHTRCCISTIWSPDDEHSVARNM